MRTVFACLFVMVTATSASAWDGAQLWYDPADGASPGGGGIFGTGSQRDHRITCAHCHVDRVDNGITLDLQFQPALGSAGGNATFVPGQRYRIDAALVGETLGSVCDPYMKNLNGFAVSFENDAGALVGTLESDSGQIQTSCPTNYTMPASGTTAIYRDCAAVFSIAPEDATTWTFYWRAPAGGGTVRLYFGGVDGDCTMSSMGDGVVTGRRTLVASAAMAASRPRGSGPLGLALIERERTLAGAVRVDDQALSGLEAPRTRAGAIADAQIAIAQETALARRLGARGRRHQRKRRRDRHARQPETDDPHASP